MATTVIKNAGRAKYNAAQKKHAQRTPLPPRGSTAVADANKIVKEAAQAVVKEAKAKRQKPTEESAPKVSKPGAFALAAEEAGWDVERIVEGERKVVEASRGSERIHAAWVGDKWAGEGRYTHSGGISRTVLNVAAARRLLDVEPGAIKVTTKTHSETGAVTTKVNALPFDPATATDEEVLKALLGYQVSWRNGWSSELIMTAVVPLKSKQTSLDADDLDAPETRQLTFCDANGEGYRTLRLSALTTRSSHRVDDGHMLTLIMGKAMAEMNRKGKE